VVVAMQASKRIERELGRAGLVELSTHLWAQNCQTCGLPLGSERPTLVVRSFAVTASASLHHGACRRPGWEENPQSVFSNPPQLTRIVYALVAPFKLVDGYVRLGGGPPHGWIVPVLLVNPGLEQVPLRRNPGARRRGRWVVSTVEIFSHFGLDSAEPGLAMREPQPPIVRTRGLLSGDDLAVDLGSQHWSASLGRGVGEHVRQQGGALLAVTTRVHPGRHPDVSALVRAMQAAADAGQVALGWLGVDAASTPAEAPGAEEHEPQLPPTPGLPFDIGPHPGGAPQV
jgi:hypothetical protein